MAYRVVYPERYFTQTNLNSTTGSEIITLTEAKDYINKQTIKFSKSAKNNFETKAKSQIGEKLYNAFIKECKSLSFFAQKIITGLVQLCRDPFGAFMVWVNFLHQFFVSFRDFIIRCAFP